MNPLFNKEQITEIEIGSTPFAQYTTSSVSGVGWKETTVQYTTTKTYEKMVLNPLGVRDLMIVFFIFFTIFTIIGRIGKKK